MICFGLMLLANDRVSDSHWLSTCPSITFWMAEDTLGKEIVAGYRLDLIHTYPVRSPLNPFSVCKDSRNHAEVIDSIAETSYFRSLNRQQHQNEILDDCAGLLNKGQTKKPHESGIFLLPFHGGSEQYHKAAGFNQGSASFLRQG